MSGSSRRPKTASDSSFPALVRGPFSFLGSFLHKYNPIEFFFIRNGVPAAHNASDERLDKATRRALFEARVNYWPMSEQAIPSSSGNWID